ncbi:MAG: Hydroxypyruvate isomerase [Rhodoglobus sp.]|nr:Hydroxypyruvate isomerase [Rhodoglobus sp.]
MVTSELRLDANLKWLFTEKPFEERFDAAASAGFTGVEYSSPYEYPAADLVRRLRDAGLEQVLINTPSGAADSPGRSGYACLPDSVPQFRDGIVRSLEYATALGAGLVHVMGGVRPSEIRWDQAYATVVANLMWASEQAKQAGVVLVLEAQNRRDVPGFVFDSIEQAASVVKAVDSQHVRLLFDVYHCQVTQGDVLTRLREQFALVSHVQIADAPTRTEPGTGETNWRSVFAELKALGYSGWVGCEYRPLTDTLAGLAWRGDFDV